MSVLTLEQLSVSDTRTKKVTVGEPFNGDVFVLVMDGDQLGGFYNAIAKLRDPATGSIPIAGYMRQLVVRTLCNDQRVLYFDADNAEHVAIVGRMPGDVLDILYEAAMEFNRLSKKEAETIAKNSGSTQT